MAVERRETALVRIERCNSWCIYDRGVCRFCGWPEKEKPMVDEIAVSDEMVAAAYGAAPGLFSSGIGDEQVRAVYRAMRALEPSQPETPTFFDPVTDQRRAVTALDVEMWQAAASAYAGLRAKMEQDQALFRAEIKAIRSRHGAPPPVWAIRTRSGTLA